MKIILTGSSGLLGSAFARSAVRRGHEVIGIVGSYQGKIEGLNEQVSINLEDPTKLEQLILERFPDAIVNCAAISNTAICESNPELSRKLNVELPKQLAMLSRHLFATLIHISSEQVFDGSKHIYTAHDEPTPPNEYARQKLEAENIVHEAAGEFATTLRVPLLMGNSPSHKRSFHEMLFHAWQAGERPQLFTDEVRQPCLSDNAADAMVELCERNDLKGVFSWAGAETLTRFEMGSAVLKRFGLPEDFIQAAKRSDNPKFANRQARLAFDLTPLSGKMKTQPQSFENQLDALVVPEPCRKWYNSI